MAKSGKKHRKSKTRNQSNAKYETSPLPSSPAAANQDNTDVLQQEQDDPKNNSQDSRKDTISRSSVETVTTATGSFTGSQGEIPTPGQRLMQHKRLLSLSMLGSVILGYSMGIYLKHSREKNFWTQRMRLRIGFPGELFFNILSCLRDPVTFTSIVAAVGSIDKKICRFIAVRSILFTVVMNTFAATLGVLFTAPLAYTMSNIHGPNYAHFCKAALANNNTTNTNTTNAGQADSDRESCIDEKEIAPDTDFRCNIGMDNVLNLISSHLPRNVVGLFLRESRRIPDLLTPIDATVSRYNSCAEFLAEHSTTNLGDLEKYDVGNKWSSTPNRSGVWCLAFIVGVCVLAVGEQAQSFLNLFISFSEVFLTMATWALYLAPVGVLFFTIQMVLSNDSPLSFDTSMEYFILTNIAAFLFYSFVVLPLLYWVFSKKSPIRFFVSILPTIAIAFGTSSTPSTIPLSITCLEEVSHLDPRVVRYLIPILASMSFNGLALYVASSIVYLALKHSVVLSVHDYLSIIIISGSTTVGASRSLVLSTSSTIVVALTYLNLDTNMTADMLHSYWILDGFVTVTNVLSDCVVTAVINSLCRRSLKALTVEEVKKMKKAEVTEVNQQWDVLYEQTTVTITAPELSERAI